MTEENTVKLYKHKKSKYKFVPPDGGWGYFIALSIAVTFSITFIPIVAFGIIYGQFLEDLTDEASATGLINGSALASQWFSGLIANPLLQRLSYRKVSFIGITVYLIGIFGTIFITTVNQLLILSILQGLGSGLVVCSSLSAFNYYFAKKSNFVLTVSFTTVIIITASYPKFFSYCMNTYGFRGTLIILSGISLNCVPALLCLRPVKWYRIKKHLNLNKDEEEQNLNTHLNTKPDIQEHSVYFKYNRDESKGFWTTCLCLWIRFAKYLDLGLFLDPVYVNISIGMSLCITADFAFLNILPLLLKNNTINTDNATILLTIFYISDIVGRILFAILNVFTHISARKLTLVGSTLAVFYRIEFVNHNSFWWLAMYLALIGSSRCFFQINCSLIFIEKYKGRFVTAFTLYFVVCGIITLFSGVLIGIVKTSTESNIMIVYLLAAMYGVCSVMWLVEMFIIRFTKKIAQKVDVLAEEDPTN